MTHPRSIPKALTAYLVALHLALIATAAYAINVHITNDTYRETYRRTPLSAEDQNFMFESDPPPWTDGWITHTLLYEDEVIAEFFETNGRATSLTIRPPWTDFQWIFAFPNGGMPDVGQGTAPRVFITHRDPARTETSLPDVPDPDQRWTWLSYSDDNSDGIPDYRTARPTPDDPDTRSTRWRLGETPWILDPFDPADIDLFDLDDN